MCEIDQSIYMEFAFPSTVTVYSNIAMLTCCKHVSMVFATDFAFLHFPTVLMVDCDRTSLYMRASFMLYFTILHQ